MTSRKCRTREKEVVLIRFPSFHHFFLGKLCFWVLVTSTKSVLGWDLWNMFSVYIPICARFLPGHSPITGRANYISLELLSRTICEG